MAIIRNLVIIITILGLTVSWCARTMAEDRIYIDYSEERGEPEYGPKIGVDWNIAETSMFSFGHGFEGEEDNYPYSFIGFTQYFNDYYITLRYQDGENEDTSRIYLGMIHNYNDNLRFKGRISYAEYRYDTDTDPDYNNLILNGSLRYQFNEYWRTAYDLTWTNEDVADPEEVDESVLDLGFRLSYKLNKYTRLTGGVIFTGNDDQCYGTNWNNWSTGYLVSVEIEYGKILFYIENQFLDDGDELSCVLSYYF